MMRDALFGASYKHARSLAGAETWESGSPDCFDSRNPGKQKSKLVTLTAAGDPVAVNLFSFTGLIRLNEISGTFVDVTNVADIEEVRLDVWDGANSVPITLASGVVCDGATINSSIVKIDDATGALVFLDADQIRIDETNKRSNLDPVLLNGKDGVTNYIRMLYKNVDTNLNCQIMWRASYRSYAGQCGGTFEPV